MSFWLFEQSSTNLPWWAIALILLAVVIVIMFISYLVNYYFPQKKQKQFQKAKR